MAMKDSGELTPLQKAFVAIKQLRGKVERLEQADTEPIAIIGMSCRVPGANDPESFWQLIRNGEDMVTTVPRERWDIEAYYHPEPGRPGKTYTRHGGFLSGVDRFDAAFFGISAREAEGMDPQQRLLLEVAWEALEHAGLVPAHLAGSATGVFVGVTAGDYAMLQVEQADQNQTHPYFNTGTPLNACAGRLSYILGLQGPCMAVDTACSSSLSAIHLACMSLRAGECDQVLAGGVNLILTPRVFVTLSAAGMMAPDGRCKTFDATANGYVRAEGCGIVVLKRYSDAQAAGDRVLALIRGSAVNQDGASSGFTAPNGVAQQKLLCQALGKAKVAPAEIDYVEAHGTGTALGDLIETQALGTVLGQAEARLHPLLVGSVKSNIGHLESAAGVAGLIKLVQALRYEELPPTLHLTQPNPDVAWETLQVKPVIELTPWPRGQKRRVAGLSSFGATGSNAHLILEEAPPSLPQRPEVDRPMHILTLSAKSQSALLELAGDYEHLLVQETSPALADVCFTANSSRTHFKWRVALGAADKEQARAQLAAFSAGRSVPGLLLGGEPPAKPLRPAWLFTGQGALYPGMGRELYEVHSGFRRAIDGCAEILEPLLEKPLQSVLYPSAHRDDSADLLQQAVYVQPALFALQYALASLWRSWGVEPEAVVGHSLGEYCAACIAGVFSLEDGLKLVVERARLMQTLAETGSMVAVMTSEARVAQALAPHRQDVSIAAVNGPQNVVVSGRTPVVQQLVSQFRTEGIETIPLQVTHAFHSPVMDPLLDAFERFAEQIDFHAPTLPLISNLTGQPLTPGVVPDAEYWRRHCREPVQFMQSLSTLLNRNLSLFIEIGPHPVLSHLGKRQEPSAVWLPSLTRHKSDWSVLLSSVAEAYIRGANIDWSGFDAPFARNRVSVPTYAFQRTPYWIVRKESIMKDSQANSQTPQSAQDNRQTQREAILTHALQLIAGMLHVHPSEIDIHASFLEMGADSLVLVEGVRTVEDHFGVKLEIRQFFEEITTIATLVDYLVDRTTFGLPPSSPAVQPTQVAPQAIAPTIIAPISTAPVVAHGVAALPQVTTRTGGTALEQIVLAQMQLMSQQLAALQGTAPAVSVPAQIAHSSLAENGDAPERSAVAVLAPAQPAAPTELRQSPKVAEDRSSPLRALANPITPGPKTTDPRQSAHLAALIERYEKKTPKSKALAQACRPGLADSRASVGFRFSTKEILYPITGSESLGSRLRDVDGNTYVDLTMGFGVLLFGSRPEFMNGVVEAEVQRGFQLGPRSDVMAEVTSLFTELTGHDRVAFTNSGTEAVMIALRLARTATGRSKIALFEGSYHGHSDGTLAKTVRVNGELRSEPVAPGIPPNVAKDVLVLEYGTAETLETLRAHAHELAAILVEPVQSRRLDFQPVDFLRQLRALTEELGTALIFDEMICGFRAHQGGAQGLFGIQADIATYGKILGGGMPIGAVAGKGRFLDGIDGGVWQYGDNSYPRATRTYFGGTFCQHPFSMAACRATLRYLKAQGPGLQERLNQRTAELAETLNAYFLTEELPLRVSYFSSAFRFEFSGNLELLYYHLLEKGVYIWEWRNCFLSTAHTDEDIAQFIQAVKDSLEEMRHGGFLPERRSRHQPSGPDGNGHHATNGVGVRRGQTTPTPLHSKTVRSEDPRGFWYRPNSKLSHRETVVDHQPLVRQTGQQGQRALTFGISYFGPYSASFSDDKYDLLLESARYADSEGFAALWVPERHFHEFGGFSPNPSVLAAALARETTRIHLRAGSVVLPLHHPIRVAEEWALVDNLSGGRAGIAFASGWHANDFVFAPEAYGQHRELTFQGVETVRQLWRGETITQRGGQESKVDVSIYPRPKQASLPAWLTIVNNPDTYRKAGELGVGVLTNLMGQSLDDLAANIAVYRRALAEHGHDPAAGHVTVLIHTYLAADASEAIETARQPMCDYLLSSIGLFQKMAQSEGKALNIDRLTQADKTFLVQSAYEKYVASSALIGSPQSCAPTVERLIDIGVNELACFVDFGVAREAVLAGLPYLNTLRQQYQTHSESLSKLAANSQEPVSIPLSEAQQQLWILAQLSKDGSRAYNDPAALLLRGSLDHDALRHALQQVVTRHESLRTTFDKSGELQVIHPPQAVELACIDLSAETEPEVRLGEWLAEHTQQAFDFENGPLFSATVFRLEAERHALVLSAHHIVSDGPSMALILNELLTLYGAARGGQAAELATPTQYRDFLSWQQEQRDTDAMAGHERYWHQQFASPIPALDLPSDRVRPPVMTYNGARASCEIDSTLLQAIRKVGAAHGCTPYMVFLAAYSALMHRLSGQEQVVIGAPYTGRALAGGNSLVGYCIHLLPIVSTANTEVTFADHLRYIRGTLLNAYEHQDYPFARLVNTLNMKRDSSRPPLLSTIFNLERQPELQKTAGLQVEVYPQPISFTRVDLTLTVFLQERKARLECDYNTDLFDATTIQRWLEHYVTLLASAAAQPQQAVATLPLLTDATRRHQLEEWNVTDPAASAACFHKLWEARVAQHPDRIALEEDGEHGRCFTYSDLNQRANQLAHYLRRMGVGPDQRVGVCLQRSWQLMVAMLATLKAGGAYVPLDPSYPSVRLSLMQSDARITVLLTQETFLAQLTDRPNQVCCLDREWGKIASESAANPDINVRPANLAYVIYTSGSTGKPKGVMISHHGLVNYLTWAVQAYAVQEEEGAPVLGSIGFDATVTSLFVPLLAGGKVILLTEGGELEALASLHRSARTFSFIKLTPAHLEIFNTMVPGQPPADLTRFLVLGGEALSGAAIHPWLQHGATRIVNEYGPTETVVGCCTYEPEHPCSGMVPIGRPIRGTRLHILDKHSQIVPPGVPGELYIGGIGLARGYLDKPDLTAGVFIPDPFAGTGDGEPGARLYKTGDRACYMPDGTLVFLGRVDRQVKLHGFRIELGEIEATLTARPEVHEAVVLLREDQPGHPRLVAYVRPAHTPSAEKFAVEKLRAELKSLLPHYMVPAVIVPLEEMPLTTNGKIDHQALPIPDQVRPEQATAYVAPRTNVEQQIVGVWQEVLSVDKVGIHDNFFDLGGTSLLLLQAANKLERLLHHDDGVIEIFKYPTIASLAHYLSSDKGAAQPEYSQIRDRIGQQQAAARMQALRNKAQRGIGS
ncbi:MAG: amino acid adenylation domain-containing protein [Deltaproteobacteria bacterium]|nr:amino acid adenylation domain-containing protein [Deltaproteobacteria bacterium]